MKQKVKATGKPDHNAPAKEKASKSWGLKAANYIWSYNAIYNDSLGMFFNNDGEYDKYIRYARGEQDVNREVLGINPRSQGINFVKGIRWQIKNYITKRVNVAVSKIRSRTYDPIAQAIDPHSKDRREELRAKIRAIMNNQEWMVEAQNMFQENMLPEEITADQIPLDDTELDIFLEHDHKFRDEMYLEEGIQYHLNQNNFNDTTKRAYDWDLFVLGVGAGCADMDSHEMPITKYADPARLIVPRTEREDFGDIEFVGYVNEYMISDFKEMQNEFSEEEEKKIIAEYAKPQSGRTHDQNSFDRGSQDQDVDKIQIMHFEIKSTNEDVHLEMKDRFGNPRFISKDDTYYRTEKEQDKFNKKYGKSRRIHRNKYPVVYRGYWIVGSDKIFGYGPKYHNTGELSYKIHAPNLKNGRVISTLKQMIPCADNLEVYDKKIQQIVARAKPKGIAIDLYALRQASFSIGDRKLTPHELLEMFEQTGVFVYDTKGEITETGGKVIPITEMNNGMSEDIAMYLQLMANELQTLDEIIGMNAATTAGQIHQETGKAVTEIMNQASEVALDYLYQADRILTKQIYEELCKLHQQSIRYNPEVYENIFSKEHIKRMKSDFSKYDYGIDIEARPTQAEWQRLYQEMDGFVKAGMLLPEDKLEIEQSQTLKQAKAVLKVKMKRRRREDAERAQMDAQVNSQQQQESVMVSHQAEMEKLQAEYSLKERMMMLEMEKVKLESELRQKEIMLQKDVEGSWKSEHIELEGDNRLDEIAAKGAFDLKKEQMKPKPVQKAPAKN